VFDAERISDGPISSVLLIIPIPQEHGSAFTNDVYTPEAITRRGELFDKIESKGNLFNEA